MRAIAASIVMFSGVFLWSAGTIGYSLMYMAKQGNIHPPQLASGEALQSALWDYFWPWLRLQRTSTHSDRLPC